VPPRDAGSLPSSHIPRDELTVQTKLPGRHHDHKLAVQAGHDSLALLGLDRIDMLLIHWPNPITNKFRDAWCALVELQKQSVARSIGVTPAQAILRWQIQLGNVPLPKSSTPSRQAENLDVFDLELTDAEVAAISALTRGNGRLFGGDPATHEEM
jgi:diketogulonate reductase-like aldo/keto reductase